MFYLFYFLIFLFAIIRTNSPTSKQTHTHTHDHALAKELFTSERRHHSTSLLASSGAFPLPIIMYIIFCRYIWVWVMYHIHSLDLPSCDTNKFFTRVPLILSPGMTPIHIIWRLYLSNTRCSIQTVFPKAGFDLLAVALIIIPIQHFCTLRRVRPVWQAWAKKVTQTSPHIESTISEKSF